jgi:hypothetical protein
MQDWTENKQLIKFFRNCFTTLLGKESFPLANLPNKSLIPLRLAGDGLIRIIDSFEGLAADRIQSVLKVLLNGTGTALPSPKPSSSSSATSVSVMDNQQRSPDMIDQLLALPTPIPASGLTIEGTVNGERHVSTVKGAVNPWSCQHDSTREDLTLDEVIYRCERVLIGAECCTRLVTNTFKPYYMSTPITTCQSEGTLMQGLFAQLGSRPTKDVAAPDECHVMECIYRIVDVFTAVNRAYDAVTQRAHTQRCGNLGDPSSASIRLGVIGSRLKYSFLGACVSWQLCVNTLGFVKIREFEKLQQDRRHGNVGIVGAEGNPNNTTLFSQPVAFYDNYYFSSQASSMGDDSFVLMLTCDGSHQQLQPNGLTDDGSKHSLPSNNMHNHWVAGSSRVVVPIVTTCCKHIFKLFAQVRHHIRVTTTPISC